jgi:hypothetical protein
MAERDGPRVLYGKSPKAPKSPAVTVARHLAEKAALHTRHQREADDLRRRHEEELAGDMAFQRKQAGGVPVGSGRRR